MTRFETEEQQVEAIKRWWKENGTAVIIGIVLAVSSDYVNTAVDVLTASGESPYRIGEIVDGKGQVQIV